MKNSHCAALAILTTSLFTAALPVFAASQSLEGIVSDSMCVKKHMMPGKSDAECIKECVKAGSTYVLVVGDKAYSLKAKPAVVAPFAGKHVQIQGAVKQNAVDVNTIKEVKPASHSGMTM